jgi:sialic acid synthase SpsE
MSLSFYSSMTVREFRRPPLAINGREISEKLPPYIIAELSCNHSGSIEKAYALIDAAKRAGADAVKLQTYEPADLTTPNYPKLWNLYEQAKTPRAWHAELFLYARTIGITIFSSAFSVDGVRYLESLDTPAHKIASAEINDAKLVRAALDTGKPVIVSLGMAHSSNAESLAGYPRTILLHCVAQYPARVEDANLSAIKTLQEIGHHVGLSDHTPGYETAIAATALGAVMIEKHFKLDDDCIDAAYSLNPEQFAAMCKAVRAVHAGMGDGVIRPTCKPRQR